MNPIFVDTSYYIATLVPDGKFHQLATELNEGLENPMVVSEFVLTEFGNAMSNSRYRTVVAQIVERLKVNPLVIVEPASSELFQAGLALYNARSDKAWSLVDCTSFVVMQRHRITEALTTDHHFEQAGFTILLT